MVGPTVQPANQRPKRQRVDALIDLRLADQAIDRDAKLFDIIKKSVLRNFGRPRQRGYLKTHRSLYVRYRGNGFPVKGPKGTRLPQWRSLSPWLKVQMALLVLEERGFLAFRVRMDQGVTDHLAQVGGDLKDTLRDKLARQLKTRFHGAPPMFFFVMEDRDKDDTTFVEPHAHGAIELRRVPLPRLKNGSVEVAWRRAEKRHGTKAAELAWGKWLIRDSLRAACGPLGNGVNLKSTHRGGSVWLHRARMPIFNSAYVDYIFKNATEFSPTLGDRRLALPYPLLREAKRLWGLIAKGESALSQWP